MGEPGEASKEINARAETLARAAAFRDAYRRRRCLVPVDGFYEWLRDGTTPPLPIHDPADQPIALAGLWTGRNDPETEAGSERSDRNDAAERLRPDPRPDAGRRPAGDVGGWLDPTTRPGELRTSWCPGRRRARGLPGRRRW